MTSESHRLALRAAARLALSALAPLAAVACASATSDEASTPTSASTDDLSSERDAGPRTPKEVALYCAAEAPGKTPRECCDTELATASFEKDGGTDSLTRGCCEVLVRSQDPWASEQLGACCRTLGTPHGPACTPWGPPVPAAMGWKPGAPSARQVLAA